jgi:hypothetical protein
LSLIYDQGRKAASINIENQVLVQKSVVDPEKRQNKGLAKLKKKVGS